MTPKSNIYFISADSTAGVNGTLPSNQAVVASQQQQQVQTCPIPQPSSATSQQPQQSVVVPGPSPPSMAPQPMAPGTSVVPSSGTGTVYYGQGHPVQTVSSSAVPPPVQTVPQQQAYQPTYYYQHQPVAAQPQHPPNAASVTTSVQPQSQQVATMAPAGSHPGSSYATPQQGYTYSYPDYTTPPPQVPTMMMVPPIPPPAPHPQHSDPYYQTVQGNGAMGVPQQGHVTQPPMQTQHGVMSPSLTSGFSGSGADCKSTETSSILSAASYSSGAAPHVNNNYNYGDHSQYYSNKKGGYHNYYNNNNNQQQLDYNTMGSSYNGHHNHHGASSNPSSRSYGSSSSGNSGSSSSSKNNQSSSTGTNNMHGNLVDTGVCGSGNSLQVNSKLTSGGSGACHAPTVTNNSNMNSHGTSSNNKNMHDSRNSNNNKSSSAVSDRQRLVSVLTQETDKGLKAVTPEK